MDRDSINLFKKRFLEYNRVRYEEIPNWSVALNSLTVDDINVLEYIPDPESKYRTVLTEVQSDKFHLTGLNQQYTKAYFGTETIAQLSDKKVYPDLYSVLNLNIAGVFFYINEEEPEFPHVVVATSFIRKWDDGLSFVREVVDTINKYTHYDLKLSECTVDLNETDSSGERLVMDVEIDNHTIWGKIKVGQIPAHYPLGTYPYEYLGKFNEFHLINKEALLNLADIADSSMDAKYQLEDPLVWLKFRYYGKTMYVPKYPILTNVSWNQLNERGMCLGKTIIKAADGQQYRLRLLNISELEEGNEWDNLIKRCVADSGMTEWEAFNYKNEMQYGYRAGITYFYSGVLTEGVTADEQRYIVGGRALVNEKVPVSPTAKQTSMTAADYYTNTTYAGWLPVLELRGCDVIDIDTIHPHWLDLRDPIPDQTYSEQTTPEGMVFSVKVTGTDFLGPEEASITVDSFSEGEIKKISVELTEVMFEGAEPYIAAHSGTTGGVKKIEYVNRSSVNTDDNILDISVDPDSQTKLVGFVYPSANLTQMVDGKMFFDNPSMGGVSYINFEYLSRPHTSLKDPVCFLAPKV